MPTAYLALGANLGDRPRALAAALAALGRAPGCKVDALSAVYETRPVGVADQPDFLNCAARLATTLAPLDLLDLCLSVEQRLGRVRRERWGPRAIDLDLLAYDDLVLAGERLALPHPRLHERAFVLAPLAELAPALLIGGRTVLQHLARADRSGIRRLAEPLPSLD